MVFELHNLGFNDQQIKKLRSASRTLQKWFEMECGSDDGCIVRISDTAGEPIETYEGIPCLLTFEGNKRCYTRIVDKEAAARSIIKSIGEENDQCVFYIQTDPRGAALYAVPKEYLVNRKIEQIYPNGVAIY